MKFRIYCEDCCEYLEEEQLRRMVYVGNDVDYLCCPYCNSTSDLRLTTDKESK